MVLEIVLTVWVHLDCVTYFMYTLKKKKLGAYLDRSKCGINCHLYTIHLELRKNKSEKHNNEKLHSKKVFASSVIHYGYLDTTNID